MTNRSRGGNGYISEFTFQDESSFRFIGGQKKPLCAKLVFQNGNTFHFSYTGRHDVFLRRLNNFVLKKNGAIKEVIHQKDKPIFILIGKMGTAEYEEKVIELKAERDKK